MACFHPLTAWQLEGGEVVFSERGKVRRELTLPCGQCVGCRLERSRQWALRCLHEAQMHECNSFITLTYSEESLPPSGSLVYRDFQLFMKRLRKVFPGARFYMCGEYGERTKRPHYHACLFGVDFPDKREFMRTSSGSIIYTSATLVRLWPHGHSSIGDVNFESAAYVARYVMKKATGSLAKQSYSRVDPDTGEMFEVEPEFNRMSLKPGIGARWFHKYRSDVYPVDQVFVHGMGVNPPKFYDKLLKEVDPDLYESLEVPRYQRALSQSYDNTALRLQTKKQVTIARLKFKQRNLE